MQDKSEPTMDTFPWPTGSGFKGGKNWWEYIRNQPEGKRLDYLIAAALLNEEIRQLLLKHDETLLELFGFSEATRVRLAQIQVNSLDEFAQAITQTESRPDTPEVDAKDKNDARSET